MVTAAAAADGYTTETRCDNVDTLTYDTHGRYVIKETDCLGQDRRALSGHNGWGQPTTVKRFLNAKQDNTNAVTTTHTYTPSGWLTVSRESTGAYTGRFRAECTPASDSYCPTGTAYFIKTRQTTPTPTRREGLMHDSFNPQVGNFQSALLGNFQPVLTARKATCSSRGMSATGAGAGSWTGTGRGAV